MVRILRKQYLLRFKGPEIFGHTLFVAVLFGVITALMRHPEFDARIARRGRSTRRPSPC